MKGVNEMSNELTEPPVLFMLHPCAEGIKGKAARGAMLTYADYIAPEEPDIAANVRKLVIDIENSLGNTTG
jgi:hypothetical protein